MLSLSSAPLFMDLKMPITQIENVKSKMCPSAPLGTMRFNRWVIGKKKKKKSITVLKRGSENCAYLCSERNWLTFLKTGSSLFALHENIGFWIKKKYFNINNLFFFMSCRIFERKKHRVGFLLPHRLLWYVSCMLYRVPCCSTCHSKQSTQHLPSPAAPLGRCSNISGHQITMFERACWEKSRSLFFISLSSICFLCLEAILAIQSPAALNTNTQTPSKTPRDSINDKVTLVWAPHRRLSTGD